MEKGLKMSSVVKPLFIGFGLFCFGLGITVINDNLLLGLLNLGAGSFTTGLAISGD